MKEELVDVYDEGRNKTGKIIERRNKQELSNNEYIVSVHCFIINSSNQILLTQRSMEKKRGGKWEDTHGGLKSGEESINGIIRELNEELGIKVKPEELKFLKTVKRKKKFRDIYILRKSISLKDIHFNDGEVMDCKYVTLDELKELIENEECTFKRFEDTIFAEYDIDNLGR